MTCVMQGAFDITCVRRDSGETSIGPQAVSAPWHLSKPYWDGNVLLVQAVNATAGIFAGDHLSMSVTVQSGASVLLTSPSASRIHTMPSGEASLYQSVRIDEGAWLEWMPELFIPQNKSRYRQTTEVDAAPGARAYIVESLAPGRVAHGEAFGFDQINWSTTIRIGGKRVLAERFELRPDNESLRDLSTPTAQRYTATALVIHPDPLPFRAWQHTVMDWQNDSVHIGGSQLASGLYIFRIVTSSSDSLKSTLARLRALLAEHIPLLRQSARKL